MADPTVEEIIRPNSEDENGPYWFPWEALGIHCASYNSDIDQDALDVLRGIHARLICRDIAAATGKSEAHVELLQSIFASSNWVEYGTSPRGVWPIDRDGFPRLIEAWEAYFRRTWNEEPKATQLPGGPWGIAVPGSAMDPPEGKDPQ